MTISIPEEANVRLDFSSDMSYGDYLHLDQVLQAQHPLSPDPNELLFIIQHQASELWMKLMLHELRGAVAGIAGDACGPAFKQLARVTRIMTQLVQAWDVLATMTPSEYGVIRPYLRNSSGFQSWQYRSIEFLLGNKNAAMLRPHAHQPGRLAEVEELYRRPSIYDQSLRLLARRGLAVPDTHTQRDYTLPYTADHRVELAWRAVYRAPDRYWDLYQLAEKLVDLEEAFRLWRFRHLGTVERVIGLKTGTGGTSGAAYLRRMLDVVLFPELWSVRTAL
ncbi:tryptophan 2,3-dioxygenase [Massilia sp. Root351]|jgi:tryptophan 2,3-dioxygenase|uniref:tryptophan 2,3-dioxygenase n=1 Tax=Massilia sp. Root351 TaxID=1736522 RepID=UPI00070A6C2D|nr:tryptophan 2,3-dioxygenase [Massilia sp. Root351]KQV82189.1 tryptophan 2,3-dioxygenase [Massilia sp. Root351]